MKWRWNVVDLPGHFVARVVVTLVWITCLGAEGLHPCAQPECLGNPQSRGRHVTRHQRSRGCATHVSVRHHAAFGEIQLAASVKSTECILRITVSCVRSHPPLLRFVSKRPAAACHPCSTGSETGRSQTTSSSPTPRPNTRKQSPKRDSRRG